MPAPADAAAVLTAVRLGWYLAEVRGRNRPDAPLGNLAPPSYRAGHALPSPSGRSPDESRIEAQAVLHSLAAKLGVDRSYQEPSYSVAVDHRAHSLAQARMSGDPGACSGAWDDLAWLIYAFDAHIRDTLAMGSETAAAGYKLGLVLAESYWALDPDEPGGGADPTTWAYLFGRERCAEIERLLGNLSSYWPSSTAPAIAGSVMIWRAVAADPAWQHSAQPALYQQIGRWYELVVLGRDPVTYASPDARPHSFREVRQAIGFFGPQLALVIVGLAALVAAIIWFGIGTGTNLVSAVLGILGVAGVSAGSLSARRSRPNVNQESAADVDLAALAITTAPPPPGRRHTDLRRLVRQRSIY